MAGRIGGSVMSGQLHSESSTCVVVVFGRADHWRVLAAAQAGDVFLFRFALGYSWPDGAWCIFAVDYGFTWILWLILVVVATDIFGYFAGRTFGGPKFWPKISPKKTWSGTDRRLDCCWGRWIDILASNRCRVVDCLDFDGVELCQPDGGYRRKCA